MGNYRSLLHHRFHLLKLKETAKLLALIYLMDEIQEKILQELDTRNLINSNELSKILNEDHDKILSAVQSIKALGDIIKYDIETKKQWQLTEEGKSVSIKGSHEACVYYAIPPDNGIIQSELMNLVPNAKIGFSKAMSSKWIKIDKSDGKPRIFRNIETIEDKIQITLANLNKIDINETLIKDLKNRKLIFEEKTISFNVSKGVNFSTKITKPETELTSELLQSGEWKKKAFKPYNFNALGIMPDSGHLHPLLKVRTEFRQIFLEMGFTEMPTNNFIESSFWNFDALFQPQQHPARDAHDTFFITDPEKACEFPEDYLSRVKKVHSVGGYGSQGHKYDWKISEAAKNLLRTHTTAVSARMLYNHANNKEFKPAKFFSIDRVFRNETLDNTHLAEFHQLEGVVADYQLSLGDLMGIIEAFFNKLGMSKIRFKPAFNPYTEPSMEIFSYHEGLKKWVEVGNSGVFRPEMLLPMGLPEDVDVIAWGLSLERPTMIMYGIDDIRDLFGHKVKLDVCYNNPICRLDK